MWLRIRDFICRQIIGGYTSTSRPKSVFISSRDPWPTSGQDWNGNDSCFSAWEVLTIDNSAILCARETEVGWPDCRAARIEKPLPTPEELAKSELNEVPVIPGQDCYFHVVWHSLPFRIQEVRRQNCTMGNEIKDRMGLKWFATSETGSNSCDKSNINCRRETSKPVE